MRLDVLRVLPNFSKYAEKLRAKLNTILPNGYTLERLRGIEFWHTQAQRSEFDNERYMWGLPDGLLEALHYDGVQVALLLSNSELWLRSDLCRLQEILKLPTTERIRLAEMERQF